MLFLVAVKHIKYEVTFGFAHKCCFILLEYVFMICIFALERGALEEEKISQAALVTAALGHLNYTVVVWFGWTAMWEKWPEAIAATMDHVLTEGVCLFRRNCAQFRHTSHIV